LDDTSIPGVLPTEAFVPRSGDPSDTIAELVLERPKGEQAPPAPIRRQLDRLDWRELQSEYFESFDAAGAAYDEPATLESVYASIWLPHDDGVWNSTAHIGLPIGRSMEQSGTFIGVSQTANWAIHPFL
jgi:hypothetical protein